MTIERRSLLGIIAAAAGAMAMGATSALGRMFRDKRQTMPGEMYAAAKAVVPPVFGEYHDLCRLSLDNLTPDDIAKVSANVGFEEWPPVAKWTIEKVLDYAAAKGKLPVNWRSHAKFVAGINESGQYLWFRTTVTWGDPIYFESDLLREDALRSA